MTTRFVLSLTVARNFGGITARVLPDLQTVELEVGGGTIRGTLSWANLRPDFPAVNYIELTATQALAQRLGGKVRAGQRVIFKLSEDDVATLKEYVQKLFTSWEEAFLRGEIPIIVRKVGVDFPELVLSSPIREWKGFPAWNIFYYFIDGAGMYRYIPAGAQEGDDVTAAVVAEYQRRKSISSQLKPQQTVRCWECGREYTSEEARKLVAAGQGRWDISGFYCGC